MKPSLVVEERYCRIVWTEWSDHGARFEVSISWADWFDLFDLIDWIDFISIHYLAPPMTEATRQSSLWHSATPLESLSTNERRAARRSSSGDLTLKIFVSWRAESRIKISGIPFVASTIVRCCSGGRRDIRPTVFHRNRTSDVECTKTRRTKSA